MEILVIGGTRFVGRHLVKTALAQGHEVTLFNRGQTNPDLFPEAETIIGDRDGALHGLVGRRWDAVLDVNGYLPRLVRDSARLLADSIACYIFISTLSVYADFSIWHQDEGAPLATTDDPKTEAITAESYGPLKVLCEQAAREEMGGRALILRPGFIVGPHDPTDRFTYWIRRVRQGGEMLAPGRPDTPIQFIDVRDLAEFILKLTVSDTTGTYNVTGPAQPLTWGELFEAARMILGVDTRLTWLPEAFLSAQELSGNELPMWPERDLQGVMTFDCRRAMARGLRFRPLSETVQDTLAWDDAEGEVKAGFSPSREAHLLKLWEKTGG